MLSFLFLFVASFSVLVNDVQTLSASPSSIEMVCRGNSVAHIFQGKTGGVMVSLLPTGEVSLTLSTVEGGVVLPTKAYTSPNMISLPVSNLASGTYVLTASSGNVVETFTVYL